VVTASLLAGNKVISANPNCFELLGYDIIIDADLNL